MSLLAMVYTILTVLGLIFIPHVTGVIISRRCGMSEDSSEYWVLGFLWLTAAAFFSLLVGFIYTGYFYLLN